MNKDDKILSSRKWNVKSDLINMTRAWDNENLPSLLIYYTHDDSDCVDPSSMQDACHTWTQLNDFDLHEFS